MKSITLLVSIVLLVGSCGKNPYRHRSEIFVRKPGSKVEKAWVARNEFDQERRLLVPKLKGARWGPVQEYKEDGTIEFRDWWERDVRIGELEASPSTAITQSWGQRKPVSTPPRLGLDRPLDLEPPPTPAPLPPFASPPPPMTGEEPAIPGLPDLPPLPPDAPASPPQGAPALPTLDGIPPLDGLPPLAPPVAPAPSPFAPLPGALPGALPEMEAPVNELPEAPAGAQPPPELPPEGVDPPPELPADPFQAVP